VYLPVAPVEERVGSAPDAESRTVGDLQTARILLVEDESSVRELAKTILRRAGHEVVAADDPDSALELVDGGLDVDLLLTDIVMPGRSGVELAAELEHRSPGIAVVYMSGYPAAVLTERTLIEDGDPYIQKPFTPQMLAERIRQALSR
jgi:CheY-like chemotaxis protein